VTRLEERLRDAYQGAADTVNPETIRGLYEPVTPRSRPARPSARRGRGVLIPLAAAAAVTAIAVLVALVLRSAPGQPANQPGLGPASAAVPKFLIDDSSGVSLLKVRNAATGALVAQVTLPTPPGHNPDRTYVTSVATANGRTYLVAVYSNPCRSWLYQFQLDDQGQPSAVTPFAALRSIARELGGLAVSGDGRTIGYAAVSCMGQKPQRAPYVAVTNVATGQTTQWSLPARSAVDNVSLTADGSLLCYSLQEGPSMVGVIPASAAPGSAFTRGRTVVRADQFGSSAWISFAAISPDGHAVYFTTYPEPPTSPWVGQARAVDLATGRSRVVHTPAGQPGLIADDPPVRHLLLQIQAKGTNSLRLASLDLATGRITYLPSAWLGFMGDVITW
jgi:hypothetical protein